MPAKTAIIVLGLAVSVHAALPSNLHEILESIAQKESLKYNCSINIAVRNADDQVLAAAGIVDFLKNQAAQTSDLYAWGSVTKMFTAASIMKLVAAGRFSLDDAMAPLVNPLLSQMAKKDPQQNFSSVQELWGDAVSTTTVRELLAMKSPVPDFDTAQPSRGGLYVDPLRKLLYDSPDHFYEPTELMSVPWVAGHEKPCKRIPGFPMGSFCYSSTNFMLLGFILAAQAGSESWTDFDQSAFLPPSLQGRIKFANRGSPKDYGAAHGYDHTSYNAPRGVDSDHDNWGVDGVFAGWTASNVVASASAVANLTWEIWGPPQGVAPKEYIDQMIPSNSSIYGLGAFNLGFFSGQKGKLGVGYGHLGATYGYQSLAAYFPELNIAMTIATNIETNTQSQPSDTFCLAYNAVAGAMLGKTFECSFESAGYYGGRCTCKEEPSQTEIIV
eukprot:TRINITY_DN9687_c0_g1_i1.p1 TRINITY_DN9687_c0_g1~~TRINITY_DN9687_c0_g1_i1.p1  ORF type:complete len:442 (-),score=86.60 TRINITY_DN9687_c0_g1_i1:21-1346(-)